jgi:hypothetical protein
MNSCRPGLDLPGAGKVCGHLALCTPGINEAVVSRAARVKGMV